MKWEYKVLVAKPHEAQDSLNKEGQDRWELASISQLPPTIDVVFYLKRVIKEKGPIITG